MTSKLFTLRDGSGSEEIEVETLAEAKAAAVEWARDGWQCEPEEGTFWVTVRIQDSAGVEQGSVKVAIEPEEPDCTAEDGHDWIDQGVQGHGGGVISTDRCAHCAAKWITDTWAQDRVTGEQGLTATRYDLSEVEG
jgi:hypothetical protein